MSSASTTPPTRPLADAMDDMADDQRPLWLIVRSEGQRLGIPIEQVREVVRPTGLRRVPGAPVVQAGIVNVRGAIVTVLDLACRETEAASRTVSDSGVGSSTRAVVAGSIVLLQYGSRPIGIAVDGVEDVAIAESTDSNEARAVHPFDAVAWCARHLHSAEERER